MKGAASGAHALALLVGLYPPRFRRRFGPEMAAVVRSNARALAGRPAGARLAWALSTAGDLLAGAAAEWWARGATGLLLARRGGGLPTRHAEAAWGRLRRSSPQRTAGLEEPPFTPLPELRRRHARRALPPVAPSQ